jgi:hypothetical protein
VVVCLRLLRQLPHRTSLLYIGRHLLYTVPYATASDYCWHSSLSSHFNLSFSRDLIFLIHSPATDTLQRLSVLNKCSGANLVSKTCVLIVLIMYSGASVYKQLETYRFYMRCLFYLVLFNVVSVAQTKLITWNGYMINEIMNWKECKSNRQ